MSGQKKSLLNSQTETCRSKSVKAKCTLHFASVKYYNDNPWPSQRRWPVRISLLFCCERTRCIFFVKVLTEMRNASKSEKNKEPNVSRAKRLRQIIDHRLQYYNTTPPVARSSAWSPAISVGERERKVQQSHRSLRVLLHCGQAVRLKLWLENRVVLHAFLRQDI